MLEEVRMAYFNVLSEMITSHSSSLLSAILIGERDETIQTAPTNDWCEYQ
jgi:hypothetical protein